MNIHNTYRKPNYIDDFMMIVRMCIGVSVDAPSMPRELLQISSAMGKMQLRIASGGTLYFFDSYSRYVSQQTCRSMNLKVCSDTKSIHQDK